MKISNPSTSPLPPSPDKGEQGEHQVGQRRALFHWTGICAVVLIVAQLLIVLVSWIVSSSMAGSSLRSMLNSEGLRWFFGHFIDQMASPLLVWMVLLAMAWGAYRGSGLSCIFRRHRPLILRQRYALIIVSIELLVFVVLMCLLTLVPHAVLLSSTGTLFPSPFSRSLVPSLAFIHTICSLTYGLASKSLTSFEGVMKALASGFHPVLPFFVLYILGMQLYHTVCYVFS
ncbi:MAG: AbgT family transporter [Prevotella sp.]|nr:AbgT family transporter [Prevotella sp.]